MKYRSEKRQKLYIERRAVVERLLKERPQCQACSIIANWNTQETQAKHVTFKERSALDIHEIKRRSQGGSLLDDENLLAVCRKCHDWINAHPKQAERVGLSVPGWATKEMYEEAKSLRINWRLGVPSEPSWWS